MVSISSLFQSETTTVLSASISTIGFLYINMKNTLTERLVNRKVSLDDEERGALNYWLLEHMTSARA